MALPLVRILIPVYNDWDRLFKCLSAIEKQTYNKELFKVLVIDNGSDIIPELPIYNFSLEVKVCNKKGSYSARNYGLNDNKFDIVAFTDSDCIPDFQWLETGVHGLTYDNNSCDILAGKINVFPENLNKPTNAELLDMAIAFPQKRYVEQRNYGVTANLFVKKKVFQSIGFFDDRLKSGGDTEFCQRAVSKGFKIAYSDTSIVNHPARKTAREIFGKVQRMSGGRIDRIRKKGDSIFKTSFNFFKPPIRGFYYVYSAKELSFWKRIRASLMLFVIWFASVTEWIRVIIFNKESNRS